ncbi:MAG: hypothetical protein A2Z94_00730 [Gallionellales bacterium GWA2_55_18]|nr:MAG: hypothetical protein A2Z94_00730 [Gallionellales bacterium GWA2_55_18]
MHKPAIAGLCAATEIGAYFDFVFQELSALVVSLTSRFFRTPSVISLLTSPMLDGDSIGERIHWKYDKV